MKNRDLCERPYCRERWTLLVTKYDTRQRRGWKLRVCTEHGKPYLEGEDIHGDRARVSPRAMPSTNPSRTVKPND
jgi:hypothetical protein